MDQFARLGAGTIAELVKEREFRALQIWEPGEYGPFRRYFRKLRGYQTSRYWPDAALGEIRDAVRCENLMDLTFPSESLDLIVTSDVFEHVRRPYVGFAEVHRVLRTGGVHVFSVPVAFPMRDTTTARVDTSGDEDGSSSTPHSTAHIWCTTTSAVTCSIVWATSVSTRGRCGSSRRTRPRPD